MNTFVRVAAIVLIVLGVLVMLAGVAGGLGSLVRLGTGQYVLGPMPRGFARTAPGFNLNGVGLLVSAGVFVQGLVAVALGGGLYLLADVERSLRRASRPPQPPTPPVPVAPPQS